MSDLPVGWRWATVGELATRIDFGSSSKTNDDVSGVPVRRMGNIFEGRLRFDSLKYLPVDHSQFPELLLEPGDVLFNRTNSPELVGKSAVYEGTPKQCSFASYLLRVRLNDLNPRLFVWYVNSDAGRDWVRSVVSQQVGQANVNSTKLKAFRVPVPPADVQRRIVAKLDALLAQSRAAREQLEAVPALVEQYRQSVLAAAFRGDLTADWRKQHPDVEPASKLLERIRLGRRAKWEASELAKLHAKGKAPKDDKWKSKYVEPEPVDTSDLPELPPTWCWASFGEAAEIELELVDPAGHRESPHIAPNHIESNTGRLLPYGTVASDGVTSPKSVFRPGQIIYSKIRPYLAKAVLVDFNGVCSADMYPLSTWMNARLLLRWILSPRFTDWVSESQGRTVLPKINQESLVKVPVPIPPAGEQAELSKRVEGMLSSLVAQPVGAEDTASLLRMLERALLAKAFRGELID